MTALEVWLQVMAQKATLTSFNSADSVVMPSLVDSDGFQGWTNDTRGNPTPNGGDLASPSPFIIDDIEFVAKGGIYSTVLKSLALEVAPTRSNVKPDDDVESSGLCESWRIEDYEAKESIDDKEPQHRCFGTVLLERLGSKVSVVYRH